LHSDCPATFEQGGKVARGGRDTRPYADGLWRRYDTDGGDNWWGRVDRADRSQRRVGGTIGRGDCGGNANGVELTMTIEAKQAP